MTAYLKQILESDPLLASLWVKGEISNFKHHASGHMYFTLKDERSRLKCVCFRGKNVQLRFRPEDGMKVLARGQIGIYEVSGVYQLYVEELHAAGQGDLALAFEQLKARLAAEGLFDPARKRPLPFLPRTVGVVTSPSGAAFRDIVSVLRRRYPNVRILLSPAIVQGDDGPPSVVAALER
ncbi:MAG TPA: exodeoxyribonuclease VII large subunit, partial [Limnochordia bacterium]